MKSDINKAEKKKQLGRPTKTIDQKVLYNRSHAMNIDINKVKEELGVKSI